MSVDATTIAVPAGADLTGLSATQPAVGGRIPRLAERLQAWFDEQPRLRRGAMLALPPAIVTAVVTSVGLGYRQLWTNEINTWQATSITWPELINLTNHLDRAISPYYFLMHVWTVMFGDSVVALRTPSVVAMAVTAGLLTLLGRRLFSPAVGVTAGLLFAALPTISRYGQEARPYAIAMMLVVASTLLLLRALDRPTWPRWLGYGAIVVLAGYAHMVTVTILLAHFLAVRRQARRTQSLLPWRWLAPLIMTVTFIGPLALSSSKQDAAIGWIRTNWATIGALPRELTGSAAVAAGIVATAGLGIAVLARSRWRDRLPLVLTWALFPPLFTLATFPLLHLFLPRYILFTVPAWLLLAAVGINGGARKLGVVSVGMLTPRLTASVAKGASGQVADRLSRPIPARLATAGLVCALLAGAVGLGLPAQTALRQDRLDGLPDFRAAAAAIAAEAQLDDGIVYAGKGDATRQAMLYELRDLPLRDVFLDTSYRARGWFSAAECRDPAACIGEPRRVWLVNSANVEDVFALVPPAQVSLLRERFAIDHVVSVPGIEVVLLVARPILG